MRGFVIALVLTVSTQIFAGDNPFEVRFSISGKFSDVRKALSQVLEQKGFKPRVITIKKDPPRLEVLDFCDDRPPQELPELTVLYPCRIYILEGERGTRVGMINADAITSAFRDRLSDGTITSIKNLAKRVRSAIKEVKKKWER